MEGSAIVEQFLNYLKYEKRFSEHTAKCYGADLAQFGEFLLGTCDADGSPVDGTTLDHEQGGWHAWMSNDLQIDRSKPKGLIVNSRILWAFSAVHRVRPAPVSRQMADRAFEVVTAEGDRTILTITNPSGIGGATLLPVGDRQVVQQRDAFRIATEAVSGASIWVRGKMKSGIGMATVSRPSRFRAPPAGTTPSRSSSAGS